MLLKPVSKSQQLPEPTHPIVKYGPDKMNYLTAWLPEFDEPLPVVLLWVEVGSGKGMNPIHHVHAVSRRISIVLFLRGSRSLA